MELIHKQIIDNVKRLRKSHSHCQVDLAAILNVSRSFIAEIESYRRPYNIAHLNRIAAYYNCGLHDIIPDKPINENYDDT